MKADVEDGAAVCGGGGCRVGTHEYWVVQTVLLGVVRRERRGGEGGEVVVVRSGGEARNEAAVSSERGNRIPVPSRYANAS